MYKYTNQWYTYIADSDLESMLKIWNYRYFMVNIIILYNIIDIKSQNTSYRNVSSVCRPILRVTIYDSVDYEHALLVH